MPDILRIANGQGFWGDSGDAPARLAAQQPDLDFLTLDYLAEVSMSILATKRQRDPNAGYAPDFIDVVRSLVPAWRGGAKLCLIANAGGLNPGGCAQACAKVLREAGAPAMKIGVVSGDDVLELLRANNEGSDFPNLETGQPLSTVRNDLVTANAYLGADAVAQAIHAGCRIVITGRVADPSLTVAPCIARFGWTAQTPGYGDRIAGATVAGHLIECGVQVTGGISTDWLTVPDPAHIGFPIAEVDARGHCVITKPRGTGGRVTVRTVKEQLVYEIGDPGHFLTPDVDLSLLTVQVAQEGLDRVAVQGATGRPAPPSYKVSATYRAGFRAQGMLTIFGRDAAAKARRCADIVHTRLTEAGLRPAQWRAECLGTGAAAADADGKRLAAGPMSDTGEVVLRLSAADPRKEVLDRFAQEIMPLVTAGPQGTTGYAEGRPRVHPVFAYWPCLIDRVLVRPRLEVIET